MAWKGRVDSYTVASAGDPSHIVVIVSFYDDTILDGQAVPQPVIQYTVPLSFPTNTPAATMQTVIQQTGGDCRAAFLRIQTLKTAFPPVSTVISIP